MTLDQMIKYLRVNVNVQDPTIATEDPVYMSLSDEDLLLHLEVALSRDFPAIASLEYVTSEQLYPLMLVAKKELFYALAIQVAPEHDIGADNNNYLKRDQRFRHYMQLIQQVDKEHDKYLTNGGGASGFNTLTSHEVLLSTRRTSPRNYEHGTRPVVRVFVGEITPTSIEVHWTSSMLSFLNYKVYVSTQPVLDLFNPRKPIKESATLLEVIYDAHHTSTRIINLQPETAYYIAVTTTDVSSLTGSDEILVTTPTSTGG